jgi:hypothetical protein
LLRSLIQTFQTEHFVILNGQTHFAVSDPAELDSLRGTWSGLCAEAARLSDSRNRALHEWSELHSDR